MTAATSSTARQMSNRRCGRSRVLVPPRASASAATAGTNASTTPIRNGSLTSGHS